MMCSPRWGLAICFGLDPVCSDPTGPNHMVVLICAHSHKLCTTDTHHGWPPQIKCDGESVYLRQR